MDSMTPALSFRFQYINGRGHEMGLISKTGQFDGQTLQLDREMLPVDHILKVQRRHDRLILHLNPDRPVGCFASHLAFDVTSGAIDAIHSSLNEIASSRRTAGRRHRLEEAGAGESFRSAECPHCRATIDLTGFDETPQIYCDYCDTVYTANGSGPVDEAAFSLCDQTRMYAQSRGFMELFVPMFTGWKPWRCRRVHACNAAFKRTAYKMLLCNLPTLVGVPTALLQLVRVYRGGEAKSVAFRGLSKANYHAISGKTDKAIAGYRDLAERLGPAAGVHYNAGLVAGNAEFFAEASMAFGSALEDCSNYRPAAELLALSLQRLGDQEALAELHARWHEDPVPAASFGLRLTGDLRKVMTGVA
ncbi:MAG: hypothetical protein V3V20_03445 [Algisphaera sp.]